MRPRDQLQSIPLIRYVTYRRDHALEGAMPNLRILKSFFHSIASSPLAKSAVAVLSLLGLIVGLPVTVRDAYEMISSNENAVENLEYAKNFLKEGDYDQTLKYSKLAIEIEPRISGGTSLYFRALLAKKLHKELQEYAIKHKIFLDSESKILYGISLFQTNDFAKANHAIDIDKITEISTTITPYALLAKGISSMRSESYENSLLTMQRLYFIIEDYKRPNVSVILRADRKTSMNLDVLNPARIRAVATPLALETMRRAFTEKDYDVMFKAIKLTKDGFRTSLSIVGENILTDFLEWYAYTARNFLFACKKDVAEEVTYFNKYYISDLNNLKTPTAKISARNVAIFDNSVIDNCGIKKEKIIFILIMI